MAHAESLLREVTDEVAQHMMVSAMLLADAEVLLMAPSVGSDRWLAAVEKWMATKKRYVDMRERIDV